MILLYNPPSSASRKPVLPMSLLALGQILEGSYEYHIIDGNLEPDPVAAVDHAILETQASILGVTVMPGPQLENAVPVCREIKSRHPNMTIVWGGYFPTQHFEACLSADFVDFVVRGHGEFVFRDLIQRIENQEAMNDLQGVAYRHPTSGEIVDQGTAAIPHPKDLPPLFPYQRVDVQHYIRRTFLGSRTLSHHSSYGCPFFCNFCAVVNMVHGRWKPQTAKQTADVVHHMVRNWDVNAVEFYDNNFFTHEIRVAEFADRIKPLNIKWWGEARIDTLLKFTDKTWSLLRDSGLKMVFLGAESGSDETLQQMNKGGTASTEKTLAIASKMRAYRIIPEMSFVLGNPPNPEKDTQQTIEFIRHVKKVNPATEIIMYTYTPVPLAGELYDQAKAEGFKFPETLDAWISPAWKEFAQRRSVNIPWIKDPVRRLIFDFQWVLNAYYPTTTDLGLTKTYRSLLRLLGSWRYWLCFYRYPYELKALNKMIRYQRPETSGF